MSDQSKGTLGMTSLYRYVVRGSWLALLLLVLAALPVSASARSTGTGHDPLACSEDLLATVADALHLGDPDQLSTCRRDPTSPDQWIVALYFPAPASPGHDEGAYNLALVIWNTKKAMSVATLMQPNAVEFNDPIRGSTTIDTARYKLADGVRAFGVRNSLSTSCGGCTYSETKLALYVPSGRTLRPILSTHVYLSGDGFNVNGCSNALRQVKTTLEPASTVTNGWNDLTLTTTTSYIDVDADEKPCGAPESKVVKVSYDGKSYGEDVNAAAYKD